MLKAPRFITQDDYLTSSYGGVTVDESGNAPFNPVFEACGEVRAISAFGMCVAIDPNDRATLGILLPWHLALAVVLVSDAHRGLLCEWLVLQNERDAAIQILQTNAEARAWVLGYRSEYHSGGYVESLYSSMIDEFQHIARAENARQAALLALKCMD